MTTILLQFFGEFNGERSLKIDRHLAKLLTKDVVGLLYSQYINTQCLQKKQPLCL